MTPEQLHDVAERFHKALDAKPSKGPYTDKGIAAITDSVADVPDLAAEIERLRDLTDQDAVTREAIRLAEGSAMSAVELVECFKSMRDNEWKRRVVGHRERAKAAEATIKRVCAILAEHPGTAWDSGLKLRAALLEALDGE